MNRTPPSPGRASATAASEAAARLLACLEGLFAIIASHLLGRLLLGRSMIRLRAELQLLAAWPAPVSPALAAPDGPPVPPNRTLPPGLVCDSPCPRTRQAIPRRAASTPAIRRCRPQPFAAPRGRGTLCAVPLTREPDPRRHARIRLRVRAPSHAVNVTISKQYCFLGVSARPARPQARRGPSRPGRPRRHAGRAGSRRTAPGRAARPWCR